MNRDWSSRQKPRIRRRQFVVAWAAVAATIAAAAIAIFRAMGA